MLFLLTCLEGITQVSSVTQRQVLRYLSLSYKKKAWLADSFVIILVWCRKSDGNVFAYDNDTAFNALKQTFL